MTDKPRGRGCGWGVGLAVFVVLGIGFSLFISLPLGMSTDGCGSYDRRFKCSPTGEWLVPGLPWVGVVAGLLAAIAGIVLARRWNRAPAIGFGGAACCYVVTVVVAMSLGSADPLPPDPVQVDAAYGQLTKRPDFETMMPRYRQLAADVQAKLGSAPWATPPSESPGSCDPPLGIVGDDAQQTLFLNGADGTVTADQFASVDALVTARGFTRIQSPDPGSARYRDGYGAEVLVSSQPRRYLQVSTGCFLTSAAKQRGPLPAGP